VFIHQQTIEDIKASTGVKEVGAGWYSRSGPCPGPKDEPVDGADVLVGSGDVGKNSTNARVPEGERSVDFCFQCEPGQRGVSAVQAQLLSDIGIVSTPIPINCYTRNPTNFDCEVRAQSPQVALNGRVKLDIKFMDSESGAQVANEMSKIVVNDGALEGSEDGEVQVVLGTTDRIDYAEPVSDVEYICPETDGLYRVSAEFADRERNGTATCTTFVNCTDDDDANNVAVTADVDRMVADCASTAEVGVVVKGPEGPIQGSDEDAAIEVTFCANLGASFLSSDAEEDIKCDSCCRSDDCKALFSDGENCGRLTLPVDATGLTTVELRAGNSPGTLIIAADSDLSELDYVKRNTEQFGGQLIVTGDTQIAMVGIGDIVFLGASPRILGVKDGGFNETSAVCFLINDTIGNPFPAGVEIEFDIPNNAGGATVVPRIVATDAAGQACTTLTAGKVATPVSVRGAVRLAQCGGAVEVQVVGPGIPIIGVTASPLGWALDCATRNIGAFIDTDGLSSRVNAEFECFTQLHDRFNNPVGRSTAISYLAEAGVIGGSVSTIPLDTEGDPTKAQPDVGKAWVTYGTFGVLPQDVPPFRAEEVQGTPLEPRTGQAPLYQNPRDGLVSIIAFVSGEEQFTDQNGDGIYDIGEPFVDLAEPFVDYDDDNIRDPDEPFIDIELPGNVAKEHDGPNGQWDAHTTIWTETRIMWTGAPYAVEFSFNSNCTANAASAVCGFPRNDYAIAAGVSCSIMAAVRDYRLNLVNCSATYQWIVGGASIMDADLVSVDCVLGIDWQLTHVPAGAAQPNVLRRRTLISGWNTWAMTNVAPNALLPTPLADIPATGRFFNGVLYSSSEPAAPGDDPAAWHPSTIELGLQWSVGEGAGKSWTRKYPLVGCGQ
jgi:hypothetical protein